MGKYEDLSDIRSESGVIATLICDPSMVNFSENLSSSDFTDCVNGVLYDVIVELNKKNVVQIDSFNISATIGANEELSNRAGSSLPVDIISDIVTNSKFLARGTSEEYIMLVGNVLSMAYRRKLYTELSRAQASVLRGGDITQLQRDVSSAIEVTTEKYITGNEIKPLGEDIDDIYEKICQRRGENGVCGYKFLSIPQLNRYLSMERNEMVTFLAPLKSGKSMMLMNLAWDCIRQGAKVIFLDTEMTDSLFSERLICYLAQIPMYTFKNGGLTKEEEVRIVKAKELIKKSPIYHKYMPIYNMDEIYGIVKTMNRKYGCDVLFFDYLKPNASADAYGTYAELGNLTNMLKNQIAGDIGMSVVAACQASKGGGIADSIRIGQYSSAIIKMKRKSAEEILTDGEMCGNYRMTVLFNRLGEQDAEDESWTDVKFIGNYCTFESCEQHNTEDIFGQ